MAVKGLEAALAASRALHAPDLKESGPHRQTAGREGEEETGPASGIGVWGGVGFGGGGRLDKGTVFMQTSNEKGRCFW
jgi:hypothetical protein